MRLKDTFSSVNDIPQNVCCKCRREFLQQDVLVKVACSSRQYQRRCLLGVASCPFCTVAWCGLRCAKCGGQTMQRDELEPYHMFEKRHCNRMACCGVDIHPHCKKWLSSCPGCGVSPSQVTAEIFVYLRRMALGYEAKRRAICISKMCSEFYSYGIPLFNFSPLLFCKYMHVYVDFHCHLYVQSSRQTSIRILQGGFPLQTTIHNHGECIGT